MLARVLFRVRPLDTIVPAGVKDDIRRGILPPRQHAQFDITHFAADEPGAKTAVGHQITSRNKRSRWLPPPETECKLAIEC
jgi:hypothetical protein